MLLAGQLAPLRIETSTIPKITREPGDTSFPRQTAVHVQMVPPGALT